jgi:2-oxoglutarate/2-oxoacid ferredoxin oxidoreductase subunit beta
VPLLEAAFAHRGTAVLDVISPCVTFNDHEGSTKSYAYVKEHDMLLHAPDFIPRYEEVVVDYEPGTVQDVELQDGSHILLRKLDHDYDATDPMQAQRVIHESRERGELVTGLLYVQPDASDLCARERMSSRPLVGLGEDDLRVDREGWDALMKSFA